MCYVGDALVYVQQKYDQLSIDIQLINSLTDEDRVSLRFLLNAWIASLHIKYIFHRKQLHIWKSVTHHTNGNTVI